MIVAVRAAAVAFAAADGGLPADLATLALALVRCFPAATTGAASRRWWRRALGVACTAHAIAQRTAGPAAAAFRAGLLRDIGWLMVAPRRPAADAVAAGTAWRASHQLADEDPRALAAADLAAWLWDHRRMRLPGGPAAPGLDAAVWSRLGFDPAAMVDVLEGISDDADRARRLYAAARQPSAASRAP
jgi:hypothetical protein